MAIGKSLKVFRRRTVQGNNSDGCVCMYVCVCVYLRVHVHACACVCGGLAAYGRLDLKT